MLIQKHIFQLEAQEEIALPEYKGSTFHGGFGRALHVISPIYYDYFYGEKRSQVAKPYVMSPPLDTKTEYQAGEVFSFALTLFGEACEHYSICHAAVEYLGNHMGLGANNGKFKVTQHQIQEYKSEIPEVQSTEQITINLKTIMRIKKDQSLIHKAPEFSVLIQRIIKRQQSLSEHYNQTVLDDQQFAEIIEKSKQIQLHADNTKWQVWNRFSRTQKKRMPFGGLTGNIIYQGNIKPFIKTLGLGEWLHVGGKTTFGLGKYRLEIRP